MRGNTFMPESPLVSIVMGSDSDLEIMNETAKALDDFGIPYEIDVTSAHRSPARTMEFARTAASRGVKVIIAGAGGAAHLAAGYGLSPFDRADAGRNSGCDGRHWQGRRHERRYSRGADYRTEQRHCRRQVE